jgi:hypothetical protein
MNIPLFWSGRQVGMIPLRDAQKQSQHHKVRLVKDHKTGLTQRAIVLEGAMFGRIFIRPPSCEDCFTVIRSGGHNYAHHARRSAAYNRQIQPACGEDAPVRKNDIDECCL